MPLTIGELTTEVIADSATAGDAAAPAPAPGGAARDPQAERAALADLARDLMRTRAEGFDD
jgi:hypothetical protein